MACQLGLLAPDRIRTTQDAFYNLMLALDGLRNAARSRERGSAAVTPQG